MTVIATINEAENRHPHSTHSIASIPLNKLVAWDGNVRKTGAADGLDELTSNITAHGVLQSLLVRKANHGKFAVVDGRRRLRVLSSLAEAGTIAPDSPVPCRMIPGSANATEVGLSANVIRAPMHPADQFDAFRKLIDGGASVADIAARFGIKEDAVRQRLKLARVSPVVFEAYRTGELSLEQVQAFAVSDDHAAQEHIFGQMSGRDVEPRSIRRALTEGEIPGSDRRARFVGVEAYEQAGGAVKRDLFAEGDDGVFLLDEAMLDRLAAAKLETEAETIRAEGWKWVEARIRFDFPAGAQFNWRRPEPLPLSDEAAAERKRLAEEYESLFEGMEDDNEEASERLDAIEARIKELEDTERAFTPDTFAIAGAVLTIGQDGEVNVARGLVRPEDEPDETPDSADEVTEAKSPFSASLVQSLTACRSLAISAAIITQPTVALAAVVHALATGVFSRIADHGSLQLTLKSPRLRDACKGKDALEASFEAWRARLPEDQGQLWNWCLAQDQQTLLELLAFCAAYAVDSVQRKGDRTAGARLTHAGALATALNLDMTQWFSPTAENYFNRVARPLIVSAITEAKGVPAKRSWNKLKKSELAALAEREVAGAGWLPLPLRNS